MQDDGATGAAIATAIEAEQGRESPFLPIRHWIQHLFGFVSEAALRGDRPGVTPGLRGARRRFRRRTEERT